MQRNLSVFAGCLVAIIVLVAAGCGDAPQDQPDALAETADTMAPSPNSDYTPELIVDEELTPEVAPSPVVEDSEPMTLPLLESAVEEAHDHEHDLHHDHMVADDFDLDAPVARVGDERITGREFQREMHMVWQRMEMEAGQHVDPPESFRLDVLNALINARVMRILAKNEGYEVSDELVAQEFATRRALFNSEAEYQQYLRVADLTEAELLKNIHQRLLVDKFRESLVDGMEIEEAYLEAEYEQMAAAGQLQRLEPTLDVAHILVRVEDVNEEGDWEAARDRIEAARDRIEAGEAFEDVAREVSEDYMSADRGGLYPESTRGRVPAVIDNIMFDLEPGELSEPLRGQAGWHLIQVLRRNEPGLIQFEEARDFIEAYLREGMINERMEFKINQAKLVMNIDIYESQAEEVPLEHHH